MNKLLENCNVCPTCMPADLLISPQVLQYWEEKVCPPSQNADMEGIEVGMHDVRAYILRMHVSSAQDMLDYRKNQIKDVLLSWRRSVHDWTIMVGSLTCMMKSSRYTGQIIGLMRDGASRSVSHVAVTGKGVRARPCRSTVWRWMVVLGRRMRG